MKAGRAQKAVREGQSRQAGRAEQAVRQGRASTLSGKQS
jgi:hypothetical protein